LVAQNQISHGNHVQRALLFQWYAWDKTCVNNERIVLRNTDSERHLPNVLQIFFRHFIRPGVKWFFFGIYTALPCVVGSERGKFVISTN
jgi:hypothetical protein